MKSIGLSISNIISTIRDPKGDSVPSNALLDEGGDPVLTEDGDYILIE